MPRKPPPEHTRFKKGQSGNPAGRPKSRLTVESLREIIDRMSFMTRKQLDAVIENEETPMIELQIASVLSQAVKSGDYSRVQFILDRVLGKVANVNENTNTNYDADLMAEPREQLYTFLRKVEG